jgi:DnaJ-domain-containing protein 1
LGAAALRQGDYPKATKMLQKSLSLYPLPGVEALLTHAKSKLERDENRSTESAPSSMNGDTSTTSSSRTSNNGNSNTNSSTQPTTNGADGRAYTTDQVNVVRKVLAAKEGGRGAHYRVLDIASAASEADIKKAYRKLSLKVHPDKVRERNDCFFAREDATIL